MKLHRIIIEDKDQELLYKLQGLLRKPGEKPLSYSETVIRSMKLACKGGFMALADYNKKQMEEIEKYLKENGKEVTNETINKWIENGEAEKFRKRWLKSEKEKTK